MEIIEIKDLIASLYAVYGNDWSGIARQVQAKGYYKEMDVRSLADKIRKSKARGALRYIDTDLPGGIHTSDDEDDFPSSVKVNSVASREATKLVQLEHVVGMTADKILEIAGFSADEWKLVACKFKYWNVFCRSRSGKPEINELFAASVTAAPKINTDT